MRCWNSSSGGSSILRTALERDSRPERSTSVAQSSKLQTVLSPNTAAPAAALSPLLHELVTNAIRYGALSVTGGTIGVSWTVEHPAGEVVLSWLIRSPGTPLDEN